MRGIRRSVMTTDRGLDRKNVHRLTDTIFVCLCVCLLGPTAFSRWQKYPQLIIPDCLCVRVCSLLSSWVPGMQQWPSWTSTHKLPLSHLINIPFFTFYCVLKANIITVKICSYCLSPWSELSLCGVVGRNHAYRGHRRESLLNRDRSSSALNYNTKK